MIVTETQRNCVTVFSAATREVVTRFGQHGNHPGEFENPREVAVSADGHVFVMDNNQIQKFTLFGHHKANLSRSARHIGYGMAILSHNGGILTCSTSEKIVHKLSHGFGRFESFSNIPMVSLMI